VRVRARVRCRVRVRARVRCRVRVRARVRCRVRVRARLRVRARHHRRHTREAACEQADRRGALERSGEHGACRQLGLVRGEGVEADGRGGRGARDVRRVAPPEARQPVLRVYPLDHSERREGRLADLVRGKARVRVRVRARATARARARARAKSWS
jgi:hypothetical protein